jgi:hypothetical protein
MPRPRKTDRGPRTTASKPPFVLADWRTLLHKEVMKERDAISLDDPAILPLMHVANILQSWVRAAPQDKEREVLGTARLRLLSIWVTDGISPRQRHGEEMGRWPMLDGVNKDEYAAALAARTRAFDLVRGNGQSSYRDWLAKMKRSPLIARSVKQWTDYAPDLWKIFRSELRPDPGDLAAFRFVQLTAPTISGETPSFNAVRTELLRGRWQKR